MDITLQRHTPLSVCIDAVRICWDSGEKSDTNIDDGHTDDIGPNDERLLRSVIGKGHESVIEHIAYSFHIEGISRACSHQLVRHRIASFSQRSQRFVNEDQFEYVVPPSVRDDIGLRSAYERAMGLAQGTYDALVAHGVKKEDARFVLPNACTTALVMTINARSLRNFFTLRLSKHAQWEIRDLAATMLAQLPAEHAVLFGDIIENQ